MIEICGQCCAGFTIHVVCPECGARLTTPPYMIIPNKFKMQQFRDEADDKWSPPVVASAKDLGLPPGVAPINFTVTDEDKTAEYKFHSRLTDEGKTIAWMYETSELGFPQNLSILNS